MRRRERPPPKVPTPPEITGLVRKLSAGRRSVSIRELCQELWPALPWLPTVPGEDNARGTAWWWHIEPPLRNGRRAWEASCANWLWCEPEALVKAGKLERAQEGEVKGVDAVAMVRYRLGPETVQHPPPAIPR